MNNLGNYQLIKLGNCDKIRKLRLNFYIGIDYSYIKEYMQKCRICVNILICVNKHDKSKAK